MNLTVRRVGYAATAPIAGGLLSRFSARAISSIGLALTAIGLFTLSTIINPSMNSGALAVCLLLVGAGVGLFMTSNTSAIMKSVTAPRRGIANGIRQTAQNAGFAISTAMALAIVTSGLSEPTQQAVYTGAVSGLASDTLTTFNGGVKWALLALGTTCVLALIASLSRGPDTL